MPGDLRLISTALVAKRFARLLVVVSYAMLLTFAGGGISAFAGTTQYYYDDLGRIVQAIGSDGSIRQYQYDANGNITAINRVSGSTLTISGLSPSIGHVTAPVTIFGSGFSTTPSANDVRFGSIPAIVTSATATQLVVTVPEGAVTGPVSVTSGGHTSLSSTTYVVRMPSVNGISPQLADAGAPVTLLGSNMNLIPGSSSFTVGGVPVALNSIINGRAVITAPANSGLVTVQTPYGEATSATGLSVVPWVLGGITNVTSFTPLPPNAAPTSISISQQNKFALLRFQATQGQLYSLRISSQTAVPSDTTIVYSIYLPDQTAFTGAGFSTDTGYFDLPPIPQSGTYLLAIGSGAASSAQMDVELLLSPTLSPDGEPNNVSTTAGRSQRFSYQATGVQNLGLGLTNMNSAAWAIGLTVHNLSGVEVGSATCFPGWSGCQVSLRNLQPGHYSIAITPWEAVPMSATLTFSQNVTGTLTPNIPLDVELAVPGQNASLTFATTGLQSVTVNMSDVTTDPAQRSLDMRLYDSTGAEINDLAAAGATKNFPNLPAGDYTLLIAAEKAATAQLKVTMAAPQTVTLPANGTTGTFSTSVPGQGRYFRFNGAAGQNLSLALTDLTLTPMPWSNFVGFYVERPDGSLLTSSICWTHQVPGCQLPLLNLPQTGAYTVGVWIGEQSTMQFALTLSPMIGGALALNTPVNVALDVPGENALYTFSASAGQNIAINIRSVVTEPADRGVSLLLYDGNGVQVSSIGTGGVDATWNITDMAAGNYSLLVQPGNAATATLQLSRAAAATGTLTANGTTNNFTTSIPGQSRYFTFAGTAGQDLGLALTNLVTLPGGGSTSVSVWHPSGWSIAGTVCYSSVMPNCSVAIVDLPTTGTYRVVIENGQWSSSFGLTLSQSVTGTATLNTPINISLPTKGQNAVYTFAATAGQSFTLNVNSIATVPSGKQVNVGVLAPPDMGSVGGDSGTTAFTIPLTISFTGTQTIVITPADAATATLQITLTPN